MKKLRKAEKFFLGSLIATWCKDHVIEVEGISYDSGGVIVDTDYGSISGTRNNSYLVFGGGQLLQLGLFATGKDFSELLKKMDSWYEKNAGKMRKRGRISHR